MNDSKTVNLPNGTTIEMSCESVSGREQTSLMPWERRFVVEGLNLHQKFGLVALMNHIICFEDFLRERDDGAGGETWRFSPSERAERLKLCTAAMIQSIAVDFSDSMACMADKRVLEKLIYGDEYLIIYSDNEIVNVEASPLLVKSCYTSIAPNYAFAEQADEVAREYDQKVDDLG